MYNHVGMISVNVCKLLIMPRLSLYFLSYCNSGWRLNFLRTEFSSSPLMRTPGKIDCLGEDVLGRKKKEGVVSGWTTAAVPCVTWRGAFPHDLRWFSAYAAKWLGISHDHEIERVDGSVYVFVDHVNFFRNKISYA